MISIERQLTRELLAIVLVLLGGGLTALYFSARDAATDQFDTGLRAKALAISTLTFRTAEGVRVDFSDRFMRGFDDRRSHDFFQMWDADDREIARSESLLAGKNLPRRTGDLDDPKDWNLTLPNGRPGRAIGFAFTPKTSGARAKNDSSAREIKLVVASDREELDETLWELLGFSAGWGVLLVVATLVAVPRVLRRGLRPLNHLGEQASRIDADSLATRFELTALPSELRPIAQRLNDLLGRLERSFERERRFSADLAHELRTPLAELRSMAECALKWPDARESSTDRDTLAIAQQMERIVTHILALARGEQGQLAIKLERVALAPLVQSTWSRFAPRAAERELRVSLDLPAAAASADAALLASILVNLFENAVDYAPIRGNVAISIQHRSNEIALVVANTTSDLQPDDVPKLFDRFWRKEAARSGGTHSGLGLALAQSFAAAMQWTLTAQLNEAGEIAFTLSNRNTSPERSHSSV